VEEDRPLASAIGDDGPKTARAPFPRLRDPLFDEPAAEICIDRAGLGAIDSLSPLTASRN
jgi:hypothetical protein